jgi:hypothetical protein
VANIYTFRWNKLQVLGQSYVQEFQIVHKKVVKPRVRNDRHGNGVAEKKRSENSGYTRAV